MCISFKTPALTPTRLPVNHSNIKRLLTQGMDQCLSTQSRQINNNYFKLFYKHLSQTHITG